MSSHAEHADYVDISHHIVPSKHYVMTFFALVGLMVATVVASQVTLVNTFVNNVVAMVIAIVKATLVVMIFMNVRNGTKLIKMWVLVGLLCFSLFFIMVCDYEFRKFEVEPSWDKTDTGSAMPRVRTDQPLEDPNHFNIRVR